MPECVEDGPLFTVDFTSALLLILDLLSTLLFGLLVKLILLLLSPAWLRFTLEFCFKDVGLSDLDLCNDEDGVFATLELTSALLLIPDLLLV